MVSLNAIDQPNIAWMPYLPTKWSNQLRKEHDLRFLIFLFYNLLVYPIFFFSISLLSLFSKKNRDGYIGRFKTNATLKNYFNENAFNSEIYWFHCSSYGEYLQIDPVINIFKKKES